MIIEDNITVLEVGADNSNLKRGVAYYYASQELLDLMTKIRLDVNCSKKRNFNSDLIKGKTFELVNQSIEKQNEQLKLFKANKSQIKKIDQFFMSKVNNDNLNEPEHSVSDFYDIESLIANFHIVDSEKATTKELQDLEYTSTGSVGLNYKSPHFVECYIKILELTLMTLDFEIAVPIKINIPENNPYVTKIREAIKNLPEVKQKNKTYVERGMTDRGLDVDDIELFNKDCTAFKNTLTDDEVEQQQKNKSVVSVLLNTIQDLNKMENNNKIINKCNKKINEIIHSLNDDVVKRKTNTDYIIHLLKNLNFTGYYIDKDRQKIIDEVKKNMVILNNSIAEYHSYLKDSESTVKGQYQYAGKVKITLLKIAMSNYNLTKQYNKKV